MKKLIFIIVTIMCLLSSFIATTLYSLSSPSYLSAFPSCIVTDNNLNALKNEDEFYSKIENLAKENNLTVARSTFDSDQFITSSKDTVYTTAVEGDQFFSNIKLKSGHYFDENSTSEQFLSSKDTHDPNQIGIIEQFDGTSTLEIRPFKAQIHKGMPSGFSCYIDNANKEICSKFENDLNQAFIPTKGIESINATMALNAMVAATVPLVGAIIGSLYVLFIISLSYFLIKNYKEFAVNKLLGVSNLKIVKNILKTVGIIFIYSEIINFISTTIGLYLFNSFAFYFKFMAFWFLIQFIIFALTSIIVLMSIFIIKRIKISQMLKNKKPIKSSKILNMSAKVIFSFATIAVFSIGFSNIIYLLHNNPNMQRWEQTKYLANLSMSSDSSVHTDDRAKREQDSYNSGSRVLEFIRLQNLKGGMLMSPSHHYDELFAWQSVDLPDYDPYKKSVQINNNYLVENRIVDIHENVLKFPDQDSDVINLLVPEKYRDNEQTIMELYSKYITFQRYIPEDSLYWTLNDTGPSDSPIDHDPVPIKITYVKENQKYFTYNPYYCKDTNNEITDPIAIVYNNKTFNISLCWGHLSDGYFAKVDDINNIYGSFSEDLDKTGTQSDLIFQSVYRKIDQEMNRVKLEMAIQIVIMTVAVSVLVMILLTTIFNYLEQNKLINSVKRMHGYSFFKRHAPYFTILSCTWLAIFAGVSIFSTILNLPFKVSQIFLVSLGLFIFEMLISFPLIKIKELKNTKDVIKGG